MAEFSLANGRFLHLFAGFGAKELAVAENYSVSHIKKSSK